jgi:DNA-binding NarL/FixJ family response regulator
MKRHRILLADDHVVVLDGLQKLLEPHFDVVGTVEDGRALLEAAPRLQPDVILVDITMPLLNGIDAARQLKKSMPQAKIVFLSMHADREYVLEAFRAGGCGYLLKRSSGTEVIGAIREVFKDRYYVTPLVARTVIDEIIADEGKTAARPPLAGKNLTQRQREVLQLVAEGKSVKEIAAILEVSVKTVGFHKSRIMDGLGVRTTAELTKYAIAHGLVALE